MRALWGHFRVCARCIGLVIGCGWFHVYGEDGEGEPSKAAKESVMVNKVVRAPYLQVPGIPYAREAQFSVNPLTQGMHLPENIPNVLQPMGKRPHELLEMEKRLRKREQEIVEREKAILEKIEEGDPELVKSLQNEEAWEMKPRLSDVNSIGGKRPTTPDEEVQVTVAPFLEWIRSQSKETRPPPRKDYEEKDVEGPVFDERVRFPMRFPYSGYEEKESKGGSAVIYSTPKKD